MELSRMLPCSWARLGSCRWLVRAHCPARTQDGPRRTLRRLPGHTGDRRGIRALGRGASGLAGWPLGNAAKPWPATGSPWPASAAWKLSIGYYIDALTLAMFCMVTLVATCIHVYSFGYMHEELDEVTDPLVTVDGRALGAAGRSAGSSNTSRSSVSACWGWWWLATSHGLRLLGAGGDLLLPADRLLPRAAECLQRGQQGVSSSNRVGDSGCSWA